MDNSPPQYQQIDHPTLSPVVKRKPLFSNHFYLLLIIGLIILGLVTGGFYYSTTQTKNIYPLPTPMIQKILPSPKMINNSVNKTPPTQTSLIPPNEDHPTAGTCILIRGNVVAITIGQDNVPNPRCAKVTANQTLEIVNNTGQTIAESYGQYTLHILNGQNQAMPVEFGTYLAPGVHKIPLTQNSGVEIWLQ